MSIKILTVFGTRPEAIKMAPLVLALNNNVCFDDKVCITAQHREMLDQVMNIFSIQADHDLDLMHKKQDLYDITSGVLLGMRKVLQQEQPDIVLVHGDTSTCFTAALAAFYQGIKIGHVEAGLRTGNMRAPFPEEANRSLVARIAHYHFAPTATAKQNLLNEGINSDNIFITGNTVIDALLIARKKTKMITDKHWQTLFGANLYQNIVDKSRKMILITGHRRENFGQGFIDLCSAIKHLAQSHPDWLLIYPVHLNPNVQQPVNQILSHLNNVHLISPQEYLPFIWLMDQSDLILTDSGGIQEEGPSLGKPVLVMREVTERPEAVTAGTVKLVGTNKDSIINGVESILLDQQCYQLMATASNPYGDGHASERIINIIKNNS